MSTSRPLPVPVTEAIDLLEAAAAELGREPALRLIGWLHELEAGLLLRLAAANTLAPSLPCVPPPPPAPPLTVKQLADRLQRTPDWVYRHAHEIPHTKLGRRGIRFTESQLRRFLERAETRPRGG